VEFRLRAHGPVVLAGVGLGDISQGRAPIAIAVKGRAPRAKSAAPGPRNSLS
jgi:hypothetical protein